MKIKVEYKLIKEREYSSDYLLKITDCKTNETNEMNIIVAYDIHIIDYINNNLRRHLNLPKYTHIKIEEKK